MIRYPRSNSKRIQNNVSPYRVLSLYIIFGIAAVLMVIRLFVLQILEHDTYTALASGQYEIFQQLYPKRGSIYIRDDKEIISEGQKEGLYPLATNKITYEVFAQPKFITKPLDIAEQLFDIFNIEDTDEQDLIKQKLSKKDDPYEPLQKRVEQSVVNKLKKLDLEGIGYRQELVRYYPEKELASNVLGFTRVNDSNEILGQYGLEGYYNELLAGERGHLRSERDAFGRWIAISDRDFEQAKDGADLVLTLNKSIQFVACNKLKEAITTYEAQAASLVIMDPQTGAIIAMCNYPTFNPNEYNKVDDIRQFNNSSIYDAYEPGSIFKAVTLSASLDQKKITPQTVYHDTGSISYNNAGKVETDPAKIVNTLRNYEHKVHGDVTMTQVLEQSVNTGTVYAMQRLGTDAFKKYVEAFGFGELTGLGLDTEVSGTIDSLKKKGEIFSATASFGQGITVTPLQMVAAYSVFANGGKLMKPYIVDEIHYADGSIEKTKPKVVNQPITSRTASLMTGMLISVVDDGHAKHAGVPGYYIAGKTGTAQVAAQGGYGDATIHSFVGYGPSENSRFVMIVRLDNPQKGKASASTSAVVFGDIAKFLLDYYRVPPER